MSVVESTPAVAATPNPDHKNFPFVLPTNVGSGAPVSYRMCVSWGTSLSRSEVLDLLMPVVPGGRDRSSTVLTPYWQTFSGSDQLMIHDSTSNLAHVLGTVQYPHACCGGAAISVLGNSVHNPYYTDYGILDKTESYGRQLELITYICLLYKRAFLHAVATQFQPAFHAVLQGHGFIPSASHVSSKTSNRLTMYVAPRGLTWRYIPDSMFTRLVATESGSKRWQAPTQATNGVN